jgi:hypothetical protein
MLERHGRTRHGPEDQTDRLLREIVAGRGGPARFLEPSAAERCREPVRPARRRIRSLAAALIVIAALSGGLGRLSWLVAQQPGIPAPAHGPAAAARPASPPLASAAQPASLRCPGPGRSQPSAGLCR